MLIEVKKVRDLLPELQSDEYLAVLILHTIGGRNLTLKGHQLSALNRALAGNLPVAVSSTAGPADVWAMTIAESAKVLHAHPSTIRRWQDGGTLPTITEGRRRYVPVDAVVELTCARHTA